MKKQSTLMKKECLLRKLLPEMTTCTSRGFTLIELLAVVFIIAILAAVALPQYQRAVEKARFVQAVTLMDALHKACKLYYLANRAYPTSLSQLTIDVNLPDNYSVALYQPNANIFAIDMYIRENGREKLEYVYYLRKEGQPSQSKECRVWKDTPTLHYLCQSVSGKQTGTKANRYIKYAFE